MKGMKSDMAKNNCCIYEIILPSYKKVLYLDNITHEKALEIGEKLEKIKGKHYVIDRMDNIDKRTKEQLEKYVSYDETEMCEYQTNYHQPGVIGYNPCGFCRSWNACKAKNKAGNQAC